MFRDSAAAHIKIFFSRNILFILKKDKVRVRNGVIDRQCPLTGGRLNHWIKTKRKSGNRGVTLHKALS